MQVTIVDAFTRTPGAGNRAGVVLEGDGVPEAAMRRAAAAVAASETAFLSRAGDGGLSLRYFTPTDEIDFCGHATVATFHLLAETGALAVPGKHSFTCPAGTLAVELELVEGGCVRVWIATPVARWEDSPLPPARVLSLLGGDGARPDRDLPARKCGSKLFLALERRADLWSLAPRWELLESEGRQHGVMGFFVFTREAIEPGSAAHARFFAPALGVREDPVSGSANGPLAAYLALNGVLALPPGGGTVRSRAEQGDAMGKPGRVELEATGRPGAVERARVGGVAVTVLSGRLAA